MSGSSAREPGKQVESKRKEFESEALPHMDALYRTALRMTKNDNDAQDLVQEAMVKAYRHWDKFETGSNCRAWLFKIMTNNRRDINTFRTTRIRI